MNLSYYYKRATAYPALFVLFFSLVYAIIVNFNSQGNTNYSAITTAIVSSFLFALLMSILSLGIYLNKISKLHKNISWNLISWFLLPLLYLAIVFMHDLNTRIRLDFGFGSDFFFLLVMTIPFVIGLCSSFFKYRRYLSNVSS